MVDPSCPVCAHPERESIDEALCRGQKPAQLAWAYSTDLDHEITPQQMRTHWKLHVPPEQIRARIAELRAKSERAWQKAQQMLARGPAPRRRPLQPVVTETATEAVRRVAAGLARRPETVTEALQREAHELPDAP